MRVDLPPLPNLQPIVDGNGLPTLAFSLYWQRLLEALTNQEASQDAIIADLEAQLQLIEAARREDARTSSYTQPSAVLSAADVGTSATITIASHTRVYPGPINDLSLSGGTITGLPFSTTHYVFYDDVTLEDTTPNYQATTNVATAQVGAALGRHFVGMIATPADGGGTSTGSGGTPPGSAGGTVLP